MDDEQLYGLFYRSAEMAYERAEKQHGDNVLARRIAELALARCNALMEHTESVIEGMFVSCLTPYLIDSNFNVFTQKRIRAPMNIRVDVYLYGGYSEKALAVELDGHEWHERTKEQAERDKSRDRALLEAGIPVMRFTGSEINRDPHDCARQAYDFVMEFR